MAIRTSYAFAAAALDAGVALFDGATGEIRIFTGSAPATCEATATGTQLAVVDLQDPAFGAAADQNPNAQVTLQGVPLSDNSIDDTGTAGYFRILESNGTTCHVQGTVGTSGTDMIVDTTAFQIGATFTISSLTLTQPESA